MAPDLDIVFDSLVPIKTGPGPARRMRGRHLSPLTFKDDGELLSIPPVIGTKTHGFSDAAGFSHSNNTRAQLPNIGPCLLIAILFTIYACRLGFIGYTRE
jgi:hypothetical protein